MCAGVLQNLGSGNSQIPIINSIEILTKGGTFYELELSVVCAMYYKKVINATGKSEIEVKFNKVSTFSNLFRLKITKICIFKRCAD
jgi:hypothetical protein